MLWLSIGHVSFQKIRRAHYYIPSECVDNFKQNVIEKQFLCELRENLTTTCRPVKTLGTIAISESGIIGT